MDHLILKKMKMKLFVYLVYDLQNSTIETSIFSDDENIILIFSNKVFLMLWCKSWGKVAHFFVYKNKRFLERNGGLYYSTDNWKSKCVIKKVWLRTNDKRLRHFFWAIIFIVNIRSFVLQDTISKEQMQIWKKLHFVITWIFTRALWAFFT